MVDPVPPQTPSVPRPGFDPSAATARVAAPRAAGNGVNWWSEGWRYFAAAPWMWIGLSIAFIAILILASVVPLIGGIASTILSPVLAAGLMAGANAQARGGELTFNHLFAGFGERLMPLIFVGLLYLAGTAIIMVIVLAIVVATVGMSGLGSLWSGDPMQMGWAMVATLGAGAFFAVLIGTLCALPLMMACWFAPPLVMLRNEEPVAAMKASFAACLVNIWPLTVYGLIGIVLMIVATIPFGLGWFVLCPVFATSIYASYKDIFGA
jgi:uncharacterized membrane protein